MRSALAIISLLALAHLGLAVTWDDIWNGLPDTCRDECTPVNKLFVDCGRQVGKNTSVDDLFDNGKVEHRYDDCVCNGQNASTDIPNCSNCLIQNNFKDKEVADFARRCNFTTGGAPPSTTASPTSTFTTTDAAGKTILSTLRPTPTFSPTGTLTNQTVQATGAASKLGGAQNVLMAAALLGLPAVL